MADDKPKRRADRDVISYLEFSGLRNDVPSERFEPTDLATATNVDIDASKRIFRRRGATSRLAGTMHSLWAKDDIALYMSGTVLNSLSTGFAPTILQTGLSGDAMSYCRVSDLVYFSDATNVGVYDANTAATRSWGLEVPPEPLATLVAGSLTPGRYQYSVTYIRSDGQESGAAEAAFLVVPDSFGIQFTVLASTDPDVTHKRVYMTTPDGDVLYHAMTLTNGTTTYTPTASDISSMNEPLDTQFLQPPPAGQLVAYYKGHMFVASGSVLYPSEPHAYELFDLRKYIPLDGEITLLAPIEDKSGEASGFFIGTTKSCGILMGGGPDAFQYVPRADYGAIKGALTYAEATLFDKGEVGMRGLPMWLSTHGVCVGMPNLEVENLTLSRYTFAASGDGAAMFDPDESRFVATSDAGVTIVMNTENRALTTYSNYAYNSFARFDDKNLAANASGIFELVGDDDAGTDVDSVIGFARTDFATSYLKSVDRLYLGYRSLTDMSLRVITEETTTNDYTVTANGDTGLTTQRVKVGRGLTARYWQFELRNIDGGDFQLDTMDVRMARNERRINGRA